MKYVLTIFALFVSVFTFAQSDNSAEDNSLTFVGLNVITNTSFKGTPSFEASALKLEPRKFQSCNEFGVSSDFKNALSLKVAIASYNYDFIRNDKVSVMAIPSLGGRYTLNFHGSTFADYFDVNFYVNPRLACLIAKKVMVSVGYQGEMYFVNGFLWANGVSFGLHYNL